MSFFLTCQHYLLRLHIANRIQGRAIVSIKVSAFEERPKTLSSDPDGPVPAPPNFAGPILAELLGSCEVGGKLNIMRLAASILSNKKSMDFLDFRVVPTREANSCPLVSFILFGWLTPVTRVPSHFKGDESCSTIEILMTYPATSISMR